MFQTIRSFVSLYGQGEDITPTQSQCVPCSFPCSTNILYSHILYSLVLSFVLPDYIADYIAWLLNLFAASGRAPLSSRLTRAALPSLAVSSRVSVARTPSLSPPRFGSKLQSSM